MQNTCLYSGDSSSWTMFSPDIACTLYDTRLDLYLTVWLNIASFAVLLTLYKIQSDIGFKYPLFKTSPRGACKQLFTYNASLFTGRSTYWTGALLTPIDNRCELRAGSSVLALGQVYQQHLTIFESLSGICTYQHRSVHNSRLVINDLCCYNNLVTYL